MNKSFLFALFVLLALGTFLVFAAYSHSAEGEKLIIYSNFAFYEKNFRLNKEEFDYQLSDNLMEDSVYLFTSNNKVIKREIIDASLFSENKILEEVIKEGKEVIAYDTQGKEIKGKLLRFDGNKFYIQTANGFVSLIPQYYFVPSFTPKIEEKNRSIKFYLSSSKETPAKLIYLTYGLAWLPEYTLYLSSNPLFSLDARITNKEKDYKNVDLTLFYGQVGRERMHFREIERDIFTKVDTTIYAESIVPQQAEDYYKFYLGKVNLSKGEVAFSIFSKQLSKINKYYEEELSGFEESKNLNIIIMFQNSKDFNLGEGGLPSGKVRVYSDEGFLGETFIPNVQKGENITLNIGKAFDVSLKVKIISSTLKSKSDLNDKEKVEETMYEVIITNKKNETVNVTLKKYLDKHEKIINSPNFEKDGSTVKWNFIISPNSDKKFVFTLSKSLYY